MVICGLSRKGSQQSVEYLHLLNGFVRHLRQNQQTQSVRTQMAGWLLCVDFVTALFRPRLFTSDATCGPNTYIQFLSYIKTARFRWYSMSKPFNYWFSCIIGQMFPLEIRSNPKGNMGGPGRFSLAGVRQSWVRPRWYLLKKKKKKWSFLKINNM